MAENTPPQMARPGIGIFVLVFVIVFFLFGDLDSGLRSETVDGPGTRLHPEAMVKALKYSELADHIGKGPVRDVDVTQAIGDVGGIAIVNNLGRISGNPHVIQYNVEENSAWTRVCVDIPRPRRVHPYALICPAGVTQ